MSRAVVAVLAAVLLAGGCRDGGGSADGGDAEPPAVVATASRGSLFDSRDSFRVELRNDGDDPLTVETIQLVSDRFAELPPSDRDTELAPGQALLVPLYRGEAVCPADGPVEVAAVVDGRSVTLPLAQHPEGVVDRFHEAECDAAAIRESVEVGFAERWQPLGHRTASGFLEVAATGVDRATVTAVEGNTIFHVRVTPDDLPLEAERRGPTARLPVTVLAARCDVHALIESKRTFQFPVEVALDGGAAEPLVLEVEGAVREVFQGLLEACIG